MILRKEAEKLIRQLRNQGYDLNYFVSFLNEFLDYIEVHDPEATCISQDIASDWIYSSETTSKQQLDKRIRTIKRFSKYLNSIGRISYVPNYSIKSDPPKQPVLFSDEQRILFFKTVDQNSDKYHRKGSLNKYSLPVFFRLLYSSGLRNSEACNLKRDHVCLDQGYLDIYKSKGYKDRRIFLSDSMTDLMKRYDQEMERLVPDREYFFMRTADKPYSNAYISGKFRTILVDTFPESYSRNTKPAPTPHGFRHLFAVKNMQLCEEEGMNFNNWIQYLSRYMGHKSPEETMYYLHLCSHIIPGLTKKMESSFHEGEPVYEED